MILPEIRKKIISRFWQKRILVLWFLLITFSIYAGDSYCFRVYLKDKGVSSLKLSSPEDFLSPESVERRMLWATFVDETDFPVSQSYLDELKVTGAAIVTQSKWMKTVVVESADSLIAEQLALLTFVDSVKCVWNGENRYSDWECPDDTSYFASMDKPVENMYGDAAEQIEMLNGMRLHDLGYRGKGMRIAVIDAGFMNVDRMDAFSSINLIGTYNVAFPKRNVFCEDDHGTKVLSCLATNLAGVMVGTAPDASYLLIKSEDTRWECPIEEDLWAAAVEYADSVGVDIISSSLGYFKYDNIQDYYKREDINGKTAFVSHIACIAAKKGILIVSSGGNEGNGEWEKITFPSDAFDVLSVGSITSEKERSSFSSVGLTADFRIKPDVVALGSRVCTIGSSGQVQYTNGTSFSTPIIAGMAACLWQAFPLLKNTEVIELIRESSSQYKKPDAQLGYGIPDMFSAYNKANNDALRKQ
jgi:Subtilisin-like serine proteases